MFVNSTFVDVKCAINFERSGGGCGEGREAPGLFREGGGGGGNVVSNPKLVVGGARRGGGTGLASADDGGGRGKDSPFEGGGGGIGSPLKLENRERGLNNNRRLSFSSRSRSTFQGCSGGGG